VVRGHQIVLSRLWECLIEEARRTGQFVSAETLLAVTSRMWRLADDRVVALSDSYLAASAEMRASIEQRRSAVVEALLSGHASRDADPVQAAAVLGLPPDARYVVVAADTRVAAGEGPAAFETRLAAKGVVSGWRLTPALQMGVVAVRPGEHEFVLDAIREAANGPTGVSPEYSSLTESPRALELARAAMAALQPGRAEVYVFESSPLNALLARTPEEAERLALQVFGRVIALPSDDRVMLLDTLSVYLAYEGSAETAAKKLHCHPNTVRYRLRRLHDLTGRALTNPRDIAELTMATYALRLNPNLGTRVSSAETDEVAAFEAT
jgi:DNA-binding PucR family transcriptional regulator